jgi:two-component sensor histidine kinase/DNA-binding response OmpR family regulator
VSGETILVVDDNHQIADFLARDVLPSLGYQGWAAYDEQMALQALRARRPDLVIIDYQLEETNGLDLLRSLNSEEHSIPAILVTAHGSEQVAVEAFRLGVQDYLTKPLDSAGLGAAISRALTATRLRREKEKLASQLRQQVTWLVALSRVGKTVTSSLELDEVLRRIVEAGVHLTQAEEGFLALLDDKTGEVYLRAVKNMDEAKSKTLRLRVSDSLVGIVLSTGRPMRMPDVLSEQPLKIVTGLLVKSLLYVPIVSRDKVIGLLAVTNRVTIRTFTELDESMLISLVDYAAVALENARLYEQAQQEITERRRTERQLETSVSEKEILLKEIHHRVKNNLQVISSLVNLQSRSVIDEEALKVLRQSLHRIRSVALIHEKLYHSADLARINLAEYIRNLAGYLLRSYGMCVETIALDVKTEDVLLGLDAAVPCGLILNELVSNSLKHAFPDGRRGHISIGLCAGGGGELTLVVADDGVGLPANFDVRHATSLGLQLVNALVSQLDGTLEVHSNGGAIFRITFGAPQ